MREYHTDLCESVTETTWTMPQWIWKKIPRGSTVFWRVRGADLAAQPLTIITSDEMQTFKKQ